MGLDFAATGTCDKCGARAVVKVALTKLRPHPEMFLRLPEGWRAESVEPSDRRMRNGEWLTCRAASSASAWRRTSRSARRSVPEQVFDWSAPPPRRACACRRGCLPSGAERGRALCRRPPRRGCAATSAASASVNVPDASSRSSVSLSVRLGRAPRQAYRVGPRPGFGSTTRTCRGSVGGRRRATPILVGYARRRRGAASPRMDRMAEGIIKRKLGDKGFGFIDDHGGGKDLFFHELRRRGRPVRGSPGGPARVVHRRPGPEGTEGREGHADLTMPHAPACKVCGHPVFDAKNHDIPAREGGQDVPDHDVQVRQAGPRPMLQRRRDVLDRVRGRAREGKAGVGSAVVDAAAPREIDRELYQQLLALDFVTEGHNVLLRGRSASGRPRTRCHRRATSR